MSIKYIFAVFLMAAFFMTGCSSSADNMDSTGGMDMTEGNDILGNGTTDRDGEMYSSDYRTGYGSNDNFMSYGTDGYYDSDMNGIYGDSYGTNGMTTDSNVAGNYGMADTTNIGTNY